MKLTSHLLSTTRTRARKDIKILLPLVLYKRILECHYKYLPPNQRLLGDEYVKSEFKLHKDITNPLHIIGFLSSWQHYLESIQKDNWKEDKLDMNKLSKMTDNQVIQVSLSLYSEPYYT